MFLVVFSMGAYRYHICETWKHLRRIKASPISQNMQNMITQNQLLTYLLINPPFEPKSCILVFFQVHMSLTQSSVWIINYIRIKPWDKVTHQRLTPTWVEFMHEWVTTFHIRYGYNYLSLRCSQLKHSKRGACPPHYRTNGYDWMMRRNARMVPIMWQASMPKGCFGEI